MGLDLNFKKISEDEGLRLGQPFTMEEIKTMVWSCDDSKALGRDGFNMCFFKKSWQLIRGDLLAMICRPCGQAV
ncbi:Retrovirus-related Pol polyprotein LINE-1 [Gossypium australe]|uniref:Retrovirus-related Pol polyprotein LINE-1 n=1 Tax=Gossypium australe TaxID=47621 RepID=A0A5B6X5B8_9ROSI|nr:Retrovirus-related Pol polyprotein LINE-1 [Gossypium australe]